MRIKAVNVLVSATIALSALVVGAAWPSPAAAEEPPPPSLAGELIFAADYTCCADRGNVEISGECTPTAGATFTHTYQAEGVALGPYPGTFTETGTFTGTLNPVNYVPTQQYGYIVTWTAEFRIESPAGVVTGTKTATANANGYYYCAEDAPFDSISGGTSSLIYDATIRPATGGIYTDRGTASADVNRMEWPNGSVDDSFNERFQTSTGVVQVIPDKKDCKHGGHEDFNYATEKQCRDAAKDHKKASR